ncbi:hypothetical protein [Nonomuraea sp. NPDC050202]|jgi:MFS family permease|uniref:hypothetical protein n=1 Tax=Nonomuraea sp. NPDC050202 TaxID=3155035 RepID=UPI0034007707
MRLSVAVRTRVATWLLGSIAGIPAGALVGCLVTGVWSWLWMGWVLGLVSMVAFLVVVPLPERMAAADVVLAAQRFPDDTEIDIEGSDDVLVLARRRTWWGPRTIILRYSRKEWEAEVSVAAAAR